MNSPNCQFLGKGNISSGRSEIIDALNAAARFHVIGMGAAPDVEVAFASKTNSPIFPFPGLEKPSSGIYAMAYVEPAVRLA